MVDVYSGWILRRYCILAARELDGRSYRSVSPYYIYSYPDNFSRRSRNSRGKSCCF